MNECKRMAVSNPYFQLIVTGKQAMKPSTVVCYKNIKKNFVGVYFHRTCKCRLVTEIHVSKIM